MYFTDNENYGLRKGDVIGYVVPNLNKIIRSDNSAALGI